MSCEFELRCENKDKCYRCFNQKLLKLPKSKFSNKKTTKKHVYNYEVANSKNSWEDLEQQVADGLNKIPTIKDARRSIASGALWFEKGDVVDDILHPECKERTGRTLKTGEKSLSLKREWLEKAYHEARDSNKIMCLPFRFKGDDNIYTVIRFPDLQELITIMKAYIADNDVKTKEIQALKELLNKIKGE